MGLKRLTLGPEGRRSLRRDLCPRNAIETGGFTLIELLIVLSLVGILIGTFASDFSSTFARIRLNAATHDIASGLRQTRNLALANGHPERFELDMTQHAYRISPQKPWISLPSAIELSLFTTTEDILDNGRGSIRFFQDGSSSGGRITLVDLPIIFHVDVNWLTSEVTIRRGE